MRKTRAGDGERQGVTAPFPSRARLNFASLVLLISPTTLSESLAQAIAQGKRKMDALGTRLAGALCYLTRACTTAHNK